jgi:hypothetical protein
VLWTFTAWLQARLWHWLGGDFGAAASQDRRLLSRRRSLTLLDRGHDGTDDPHQHATKYNQFVNTH